VGVNSFPKLVATTGAADLSCDWERRRPGRWGTTDKEELVDWEGGKDWAPEPEISFMCRLRFKLSESLGTPVNEGKFSDHMCWQASVLYEHARG
jgi:hypothetical protein